MDHGRRLPSRALTRGRTQLSGTPRLIRSRGCQISQHTLQPMCVVFWWRHIWSLMKKAVQDTFRWLLPPQDSLITDLFACGSRLGLSSAGRRWDVRLAKTAGQKVSPSSLLLIRHLYLHSASKRAGCALLGPSRQLYYQNIIRGHRPTRLLWLLIISVQPISRFHSLKSPSTTKARLVRLSWFISFECKQSPLAFHLNPPRNYLFVWSSTTLLFCIILHPLQSA